MSEKFIYVHGLFPHAKIKTISSKSVGFLWARVKASIGEDIDNKNSSFPVIN